MWKSRVLISRLIKNYCSIVCTVQYNPTEYWHERGKTYHSNFHYNKEFRLQEQFLLDALKNLEFSSVLEVGCGFGRITKLVLENCDASEYTAIDLSPDQIENARKYVGDHTKVHFIESEIQSFHPNRKYDLVLAAEVLLHVKPEDIKAVIAKLVSLTNKYLVHVDWCEDKRPSEPVKYFNFMHDYDKIYSELDLEYTKQRVKTRKSTFKKIDARQVLFVIKANLP